MRTRARTRTPARPTATLSGDRDLRPIPLLSAVPSLAAGETHVSCLGALPGLDPSACLLSFTDSVPALLAFSLARRPFADRAASTATGAVAGPPGGAILGERPSPPASRSLPSCLL
eukprot:scaffold3523_cov398-Prasinococcus_capsulatus_cf.AAC.2